MIVQTCVKMRCPVEDNKSSSISGSQRDIDFSDYMWMGEEMEEFDKKVGLIVKLLCCVLNRTECDYR